MEYFVANPSFTQLDVCHKDELVQIANHFRIPFSKQILKRDLKTLIVGNLVEQGVIVLTARDELTVLAVREVEGSQNLEAQAASGIEDKVGERGKTPYMLPRYDPSPASSGSSDEAQLKICHEAATARA